MQHWNISFSQQADQLQCFLTLNTTFNDYVFRVFCAMAF